MLDLLQNLPTLTTLAAEGADAAQSAGMTSYEFPGVGKDWMGLIPLMPLISCVLCGLFWFLGVKSKLPAFTTVLFLGVSFVLTVAAYFQIHPEGLVQRVMWFNWLALDTASEGGGLYIDFAFYFDSLTILWMLFVSGLATLIALYASEYMADDKGPGYCRFFFAFSLFVFAMSCLVMGDNLVLLFLGWEGVGLCSYLLIGYYFKKPSAVEAAKKAFIMNRIGDLGLLIGIMMTWTQFGSLEYSEIFSQIADLNASGEEIPWAITIIPYLFMIGAFGKSAQLPLYTWLPDAMEGPTPVSALIHAATMVTAGVYLIARMYPFFVLNPTALAIVAWIGGLTALLAATIGMAQFDIKRIMAYSTVSQLGYMFLGLGVLTSAGGAFHVFTHAFFKATLFLCCGAVMHGFAGQLDLRKLSGVMKMKGWGIVGIAMLVGCINLAGLPFTAGFFSKDMIIAEAFVTPGFGLLGWIALLTAGLTAYYTFRVFFRVFIGPVEYEPGDDHHGAEESQDHHEEEAHDHGHFHPHAPGWAINAVLAILAVASILVAGVYFMGDHGGWAGSMVHDSTAYYESPYAAHDGEAHGSPALFGLDPHKAMYYISGVVALVGILFAWFLHLAGRKTAATSRADALKVKLGPIARAAENKWYVDEIYNAIIRVPLLVASHIFALIDKLIVDGLVDGAGWLPRGVAKGLRPSQNGIFQNYATGMAGGLALLLIIVWAMSMTGGSG